MLINEYRKMWNLKIFAVVLAVGIVMFYSGPIRQMNIEKMLPLFETVEAEIGTAFREKYGKELDAVEIEEIKELARIKGEKLNEDVMEIFPELKEAGFDSYNEFRDYWEHVDFDTIDSKEYETLTELNISIYEQFSWEIEEMRYYYQKIIYSYELASEKESYIISVVPPSVTSNMYFVMSELAVVILTLVILLVIPYLAWDNRAGVYALIAATKTGRKILLRQIAVMLTSTAVLVFVCNLVFVAALNIMTPYAPFYDCVPDCAAYDWTFVQLYTMQILIIDIVAMAVAMVVFFLSAFCETIVSIAAVILSCWFAGSICGHFFLGKTFKTFDAPFDFYESLQNVFPLLPFFICGILIVMGTLLLAVLYRKRMKEDILE